MLGVGDQFAIESENGVKKVMIYSGKNNPSGQKEPHQPQYVFILPSDHMLGLGYNKNPTNPSKGDIFQLGSKIENLGCIHIGDHVEFKTGENGNKIVVITKKVEPVTHTFAKQWTLNGDLMVLHDPYAPPL